VKIETVKSSSQEEIYEAVGTVRSKTKRHPPGHT
jgi:hypothetical protein